MESGRVTIGHVSGIAIRVHRSWVVIALLIAWSLYSRYAVGDHGVAVTIVMTAVATLLFFGSVLVHELAHSLEAQHRGVEVRGITLFLFGGVTETSFDVERPRDEFALTAVGPFSSFVLGALFGILGYYSALAGLGAVATVASTMAWINVALGVFNLLPGAPLDGGRILRSAAWAITGDRSRAVRIASRSGQVLGWLIAGVGLLQLFFVRGGFVGGLWLAFIGWFLAQAAKSELVQQQVKEQLGGVTIGELVTSEPLPAVAADDTLEHAAAELRRRPEDVLAVTDDDRTVGILRLDDVAEVAPERRPATRVVDAATPLEDLETATPDAELADLLQAVRGERPIVVRTRDDAEVIGIVTPEQLQRVIQRTMQLGGRPDVSPTEARAHIPEEDRA